jgi:hypothetical protein
MFEDVGMITLTTYTRKVRLPQSSICGSYGGVPQLLSQVWVVSIPTNAVRV